MKQYLITVIILAVTAVGGFVIPHRLLEWQDELRLETAGMYGTEEVVLAARTELTMMEKLQLMQKDTVTRVSIARGENHDWDSIIVKARLELEELREAEIFETGLQDLSYLAFGVERVEFLVDTEDGTKSMMLWTLYGESSEGRLSMTVDDETGKILSIDYAGYWSSVSILADNKDDYKISKLPDGELKNIAEKWGQYLDLTMVDTYEAKISTDNLDSQLFGVYEDENGMAVYLFRKHSGQNIFSAELSI